MKRVLLLLVLCVTMTAMLAGCTPKDADASVSGRGEDAISARAEGMPQTSDADGKPDTAPIEVDITKEQFLHNPGLTYESSMEEIIAGDNLALDPDHEGDTFYAKPEPAVVGGVAFEDVTYTFDEDKLSLLLYVHDDPEEGEGERLQAYLTALLGEPQDVLGDEMLTKAFWWYDLGEECSIHVTLQYDGLTTYLDVSREQQYS